jgi:hypothetical protein
MGQEIYALHGIYATTPVAPGFLPPPAYANQERHHAYGEYYTNQRNVTRVRVRGSMDMTFVECRNSWRSSWCWVGIVMDSGCGERDIVVRVMSAGECRSACFAKLLKLFRIYMCNTSHNESAS